MGAIQGRPIQRALERGKEGRCVGGILGPFRMAFADQDAERDAGWERRSGQLERDQPDRWAGLFLM